MPDSQEFEEWCRRLKASDRHAYAEVFEALYEPLFRYARSITKERASARDVAQDAFVRLWDARDTLDASQSLEAYLYRTVRNLAYNRQRNKDIHREKEEDVRQKSNVQPAPADRPDQDAAGKWLEEHMREWISELPGRQREALVLSRFEGLNHDQIAEVMDVSLRTVNNHIVRALKRLRARIHDYEPELLRRHEP